MRSLFTLFLVLCSVCAMSQPNKPYLSERLFVAPTNTAYELGDTVEVVGQLLSSDFSDFYPYSRYVYVDMLDGQNNVVQTQKLRCQDDGSFYATFLVGNNGAGVYRLRGYTRFMCNNKQGIYPIVKFYYGINPPLVAYGGNKISNGFNAAFFPEGGHLVDGVLQNVAVYVYDNNKHPIKTGFCVVKNEKDTLCYGGTSIDGWAKFSFIPDGVSTYRLCAGAKCEFEAMLPTATATPTVQAYVNKQKLTCGVLSPASKKPDMECAHVLLYHNNFGLKELAMANGHGVADLSSCGDGLLTIWLADSSYTTFAQRSVWIGDNGKYSVADSSLSIADTTCHHHTFVRYVPEYCGGVAASAYNVLNFGNDVESPVPMPYGYEPGCEDRQDGYTNTLDCWLLSAVRSLPDVDMMDKDSVAYAFAPEYVMTVAGTVDDYRNPLKNAQVQLVNASTFDAAMGVTDANGHFEIPIADCFDGEKLFLQAYDKNGRTRKFGFSVDESPVPVFNSNNPTLLINSAYTPKVVAIDTLSRYRLDEVVVKSRAVNKDPYKWAHVKKTANYMDRDFLQSNKSIFNVRDALLWYNKVGITSDNSSVYWLSSKYWGLSVTHVKAEEEAARSDNKISEIGFVLNGLYVDAYISDILDLPISDVESLELVEPIDGRSARYGANLGFVDIKLRSGMTPKEITANGVLVTPQGITMPLKPYKCRMPQCKGRYRMLVDVVSADRKIHSYSKLVEIK